MGHKEFMAEAVRLATESVEKGWGGPFGTVITHDGEIIARGQNRVLLTADPTAHGEVEAIHKAVQRSQPRGALHCRGAPEREHAGIDTAARGLPRPRAGARPHAHGCAIYTSGAPCPMCMSAIYWSRIDNVYFSCDWKATQEIGFDDAFQYEDFVKPLDERRIQIEQIHPELGATAYEAWSRSPTGTRTEEPRH